MPETVFLTAEWRHLVMLNYQVDPALLAPLLPAATELDFHRGRAFVSLIGFRFLRTRVLGFAIPFHQDFDEINLRFYVRRVAGGEVRRGVVFVREIVPKIAIAAVARFAYNEKYVARPMRHHVDPGRAAEYGWREGGVDNKIGVECTGEAQPLVEGSEEQFIAEHYWGYSAQRDGGCVEYEVRHPSWKVWTATRSYFEGDRARCYGHAFGQVLGRAPDSAFLADGSAVTVSRGRRIA